SGKLPRQRRGGQTSARGLVAGAREAHTGARTHAGRTRRDQAAGKGRARRRRGREESQTAAAGSVTARSVAARSVTTRAAAARTAVFAYLSSAARATAAATRSATQQAHSLVGMAAGDLARGGAAEAHPGLTTQARLCRGSDIEIPASCYPLGAWTNPGIPRPSRLRSSA